MMSITREDRERRVGRKLFNAGVATDEEHEYTCDKCGQVEKTTMNMDALRHELPRPCCGGIFHADLRFMRLRAATTEMFQLCEEVLKTERWDLSDTKEGHWIKVHAEWARRIVDKVEGRTAAAKEWP